MSAGAVPDSRQTLRRCIRSAKDLLTSEARWQALTLATLLIGFLCAINALNYVTLGAAAEVVGEYDTVLELEADGRWSWKPVAPEMQPGQANPLLRRPCNPGAGGDPERPP